ncbi:hypothetical protein KC19_11G160000 [Ceratodon purpureus]|uniref:Uncharacterized protein n=1 Tax=Ceratodon purpureus TaxID=3225 RepID=A0A8T0GEK2_CERPU|nr:hypothetical protein KC19_11G160000 [Ceratodon purpureus]
MLWICVVCIWFKNLLKLVQAGSALFAGTALIELDFMISSITGGLSSWPSSTRIHYLIESSHDGR